MELGPSSIVRYPCARARVDLLRLKGAMEWQIRCVTQPYPAGDWGGGGGGAVSPPAGTGAEPRKQTHFGNNLLKFGLKSGLWIAVYTPNSGAKKVLKIEYSEIEGA